MANDGTLSIGIVVDDSQLTRTLRHLSTHASRTVNQSISNHARPLGKISGEANEFQKSLAASNARVIAFGASTGIIFAMKAAFQQLVKSTIDVEKQMTEVNSVFKLSSSELKSLSNNLFAVASGYGLAFSEASKAAVEFARQGSGVEETLKRTSAALALTRISGLGVADSVSALTTILNSFQKEGLDAMDVINRLTAVDQNFAISAGAMADALSRVSSSASDANVSLNETMALIAAAKQITGRTGSTIGNSLKTIFTRVQRPEILDDLESVGVKARDAHGKILPMLDILRSLSSSYDSLASSQKSFIAETVGGVYQINILKGILRDLGSGTSVVGSAMEVAGQSADFVNQRMEVLNSTMSSQLVKTANSLNLAFSNIGENLVKGPLSKGIGFFDSTLKSVGKYSDAKTLEDGSAGEKVGAASVQGGLKGLANYFSGPGLQMGVMIIYKLLGGLIKFAVESGKELSNVNTKEKERISLNQGISEWLGKQQGTLERILTGQTSINIVAQEYLTSMKGAVATAQQLKEVTDAIGSTVIKNVTFSGSSGSHAASGYIPEVEKAEALRGGYQPGNVISTSIRDGNKRLGIIANSAENIATVVQNGQSYDFINPPANSIAGNVHRSNSIRKTGIDPYSLSSSSIRARGHVPNLAIKPDLLARINKVGISADEIVKSSASNMTTFMNLPEVMVNEFVNRYESQPDNLRAALKSLTRRGANIPTDGPPMLKFLQGFMGKQAQQNGLFQDVSPKGLEDLTRIFTGKDGQSDAAKHAKALKDIHLRPEDAQRVLDAYSSQIPFIAAYESPNSLTVPKDRPNTVSSLTMDIPGEKTSREFKIKTPIYGYHGDYLQKMFQIEEFKKNVLGLNRTPDSSEMGTTRGQDFDLYMRAIAEREGIAVGSPNSALDIRGVPKEILNKTNIGNKPVSAMELKASVVGSLSSGNMADKIFRTFAGNSGELRGPSDYVPKLANVPQFNAKHGGIGILDADNYLSSGGSNADFESMIYAVIGHKKPMRIHHGSMASGKTTASENLVKMYGGSYVKDINEIDSDKYQQYILNKTDTTNLDTGVFGLALSSASQVRNFRMPQRDYKSAREEMVKRIQGRARGEEGKNAGAIALSEEKWNKYNENYEYLRKKLGSDRIDEYNPNAPHAAEGIIPETYDGRIAIAQRKRGFDPSNFNITMIKPVEEKRFNKESHDEYEARILKQYGFVKSFYRLASGPSSSIDGFKVSDTQIDLAEVKSDYKSGHKNWTLDDVKQKFMRGIAENYKTGSRNILTRTLNKVRNIFGHLYAPKLILNRKNRESGMIPNLAISEREVFKKISGLRNYQIETLMSHKSSVDIMKEGWEYLGNGAESIAFKKGGLVFKLPRDEEATKQLDKKAEASLHAEKMFNNMGIPLKVSRVRKANILGNDGLLQRYSGDTLNSKMGDESVLTDSIMDYMKKRRYAASYKDKHFGKDNLLLLLDTNDANFTVGKPGVFARLAEKYKNTSNLSDEKIKKIIKASKIRAIDINAYAGGFVPEIEDALSRENLATGGNAILSSSPSLVGPHNPMGLAAIDKRMQRNATEAINQHKSLGQSMSQIASSNTSKSIPNLAVSSAYDDDSRSSSLFGSMSISASMYLAIASGVKKALEATPTKTEKNIAAGGWMNRFASDGDRAVAKLRVLTQEFNDASINLKKGKDVKFSSLAGGGTIRGDSPTKEFELEALKTPIMAQISPAAEAHNKKMEEQRSKAHTFALKAGGISSFGGAMASKFTEKSSASAADAIDEFTSGANIASQVLMTFPSNLGWIGASATVGIAAVSALDTYRKGIADSMRIYEMNNTRIQKINTQLDGLSVSINQLDTMFGDSSVSIQVIEKTQKEYAETLAEMKLTPQGAKYAESIESAPDSKTAMSEILNLKKKNNNENELDASTMALKKYTDARKYFGSDIYGVNQLGYSNLSEKKKVNKLVIGESSSAIAMMPTELKDSVLKSGNVDESLRSAAGSEDIELSEAAKKIIDSLQELGKTLDETGMNIVKNLIVHQIGAEKENNDPIKQAALSEVRNVKMSGQQNVQNAISYERLQQRLFLNAGALSSSKEMDLRDLQTQMGSNQMSLSTSRRQADSGLFKSMFSEKSNRIYDTNTELERIDSERRTKINQAHNDNLRGTLSTLTQSFDDRIRNPSHYNQLNGSGGSANMSDYNIAQLSSLQRGVSITAKNDASLIKNDDGSLNIEKLKKSIINNSGTSGSDKDELTNYLESHIGNVDIQKNQLQVQTSIAKFNEEALTEAQKQTIALEGFMKEINFKEMAGHLGGIKTLMDRGSRRTLERNIVRGSYLMHRGKTAEARATGASLYIESMKSMGKPMDIESNTQAAKALKEAFSILGNNLPIVQQQSANRIAYGARLGGDNSITQYLNGDFKNINTSITSLAAILNEFKPDSKGLEKSSGIPTIINLFQTDLDKATQALESFSINIGEIEKNLTSSRKNIISTQTKAGENNKAAEEKFKKQFGSPNVDSPITNQAEDDKLGRFGTSLGQVTNYTAVGTPLVAAAFYARYKYKKYKEDKAPKSPTEESSPNKAVEPKTRKGPVQKMASGKSAWTSSKASIPEPIIHNPGAANWTSSRPTPSTANIIPKRGFSARGKMGWIPAILAIVGTMAKIKGEDLNNPNPLENQLSGYGKTSSNKITDLGIDTLGNTASFISAKIPKVKSFGKGGALALSSLVSGQIEDAIGGRAGKAIGASVDIGASSYLMGARGGLGAGVSIGSEYLRNNFTEKRYGYGAGVSQGFGGAVLGGAATGGPAMAAVNGGIYLGTETYRMNQETKGVLGDRDNIDSYLLSADSSELSDSTEENASKKARRLLNRITGKKNELENRKVIDQENSQGFYGKIMSTFSPKEFGKSDSKRLTEFTSQQSRLSQALGSGNNKEILQVLSDIQAELVNQSNGKKASEGKDTTPNVSNVNSQIKVDISVKDSDKISTVIDESIIGPLRKQLMDLQTQVNQLVNQNSPRPAVVG